jgi:hypothetical protein
MSAYYLDASAAVKGYVAERGSRRVLQLLEEGSENEMNLGRIGVVRCSPPSSARPLPGEKIPKRS